MTIKVSPNDYIMGILFCVNFKRTNVIQLIVPVTRTNLPTGSVVIELNTNGTVLRRRTTTSRT